MRGNADVELLQKSNYELIEQLRKMQSEKDKLRTELQRVKKSVVPLLEMTVKTLEFQNKELVKQNGLLLKEIKSYIIQSKKEIKYVNKMRDIMTKKTGLKNVSEVDLERATKQNYQLGNRSYGHLPKDKRSCSKDDSSAKQKNFDLSQRCYSIDRLPRR